MSDRAFRAREDSHARQARKLAAVLRKDEAPNAIAVNDGTDEELRKRLQDIPLFRAALADRIVALRPFTSKMDLVVRVNEGIACSQARLGPRWLQQLKVDDSEDKHAYQPRRRGRKKIGMSNGEDADDEPLDIKRVCTAGAQPLADTHNDGRSAERGVLHMPAETLSQQSSSSGPILMNIVPERGVGPSAPQSHAPAADATAPHDEGAQQAGTQPAEDGSKRLFSWDDLFLLCEPSPGVGVSEVNDVYIHGLDMEHGFDAGGSDAGGVPSHPVPTLPPSPPISFRGSRAGGSRAGGSRAGGSELGAEVALAADVSPKLLAGTLGVGRCALDVLATLASLLISTAAGLCHIMAFSAAADLLWRFGRRQRRRRGMCGTSHTEDADDFAAGKREAWHAANGCQPVSSVDINRGVKLHTFTITRQLYLALLIVLSIHLSILSLSMLFLDWKWYPFSDGYVELDMNGLTRGELSRRLLHHVEMHSITCSTILLASFISSSYYTVRTFEPAIILYALVMTTIYNYPWYSFYGGYCSPCKSDELAYLNTTAVRDATRDAVPSPPSPPLPPSPPFAPLCTVCTRSTHSSHLTRRVP